jgi:hypothetical protein
LASSTSLCKQEEFAPSNTKPAANSRDKANTLIRIGAPVSRLQRGIKNADEIPEWRIVTLWFSTHL